MDTIELPQKNPEFGEQRSREEKQKEKMKKQMPLTQLNEPN